VSTHTRSRLPAGCFIELPDHPWNHSNTRPLPFAILGMRDHLAIHIRDKWLEQVYSATHTAHCSILGTRGPRKLRAFHCATFCNSGEISEIGVINSALDAVRQVKSTRLHVHRRWLSASRSVDRYFWLRLSCGHNPDRAAKTYFILLRVRCQNGSQFFANAGTDVWIDLGQQPRNRPDL
jgi:hypothetical protein